MFSRRHLLGTAVTTSAAMVLGTGRAEAARAFIVQEKTVREYGNVLFIGDSTSGSYRSNLLIQLRKTTLGPYRFDLGPVRAMVRSTPIMYSGLEAIRRSRAAGFDPSTFVIALGANDLHYGIRTPKIAGEAFDRIMTEAGPQATVGFFNMYSTTPSRTWLFNRYLVEATNRWPNLHVIDWASLARRHRAWHKADGLHFNLYGARQRNTFMIQSMIDMCKVQAARTDGTPG